MLKAKSYVPVVFQYDKKISLSGIKQLKGQRLKELWYIFNELRRRWKNVK